jgi:hypothetical protein
VNIVEDSVFMWLLTSSWITESDSFTDQIFTVVSNPGSQTGDERYSKVSSMKMVKEELQNLLWKSFQFKTCCDDYKTVKYRAKC